MALEMMIVLGTWYGKRKEWNKKHVLKKIEFPNEKLNKISVESGKIKIGRNEKNHIILDNDQVSRFQSKIKKTLGGKWKVVDLNSSHGTLVKRNGKDKYANKWTELRKGDKLIVGETILEVKNAT